MKPTSLFVLVVLALTGAGCSNTAEGLKEDSAISNQKAKESMADLKVKTGEGLKKAGESLEKTGENLKNPK